MSNSIHKPWRQRPEVLLMLLALATPLSFAMWMGIINNFTVERVGFTGAEKGLQESIREIPGFIAFGVVFLLLLIHEQRLAIISLFILGIGVAVTGYFPNVWGIYIATFVMSMGYHYNETVQQSLQLQWLEKDTAPEMLGKIVAVGAFGAAIVFASIWFLWEVMGFDYKLLFLIGGGATLAVTLICWLAFPRFEQPVKQNTHLVLRKRYWLYYALTFMGGARRQIFIVFAAFMLVDKFGLEVHKVAGLLLANQLMTMWLAPRIGRFVRRFGERSALIFEYCGLMLIFTAYAFVDHVWIAVALYMLDHIFFALAIAMKTYFQKIGDPADMAPTAGVAFSINHIAAVTIPVILGPVYVYNMMAVFLIGTAMAFVSLILAFLVPRTPKPGHETLLKVKAVPQPAE